MTDFDVEREELLVFRVGEEYLFSQYFERRDVFGNLQEYYDEGTYRFEVPASEFDEVREHLRDAYYEPRVVEDLEPYCVVKEQYTAHADILKNAVVHWERRGHNFFLMEDDLAVKEALEAGATSASEIDLALGL